MHDSSATAFSAPVATSARPEPEACLFFDIDNCLYSNKTRVDDFMVALINKYFHESLGLPEEEAAALHKSYYRDHGLAIQGLLLHHDIDVSDFNSKVDDALPLDDVIHADAKLRSILEDIDRSKVRVWLFTNAYKNHGERVVRLLGIEDQFDGLTFCDYFVKQLICKPQTGAFEKAMRESGMSDWSKCYFVDDSALNVAAATRLGWNAVNVREDGELLPESETGYRQIRSIYEVRDAFPHLFKSTQQQQ